MEFAFEGWRRNTASPRPNLPSGANFQGACTLVDSRNCDT
jgi:hypothetical protein